MKFVKKRREPTLFERFLHSQTSGSLVLILAAATALLWANSPWSNLYFALSHLDVGAKLAGKVYELHLAHLVKDGLMTVFFFVVGLEIKREILVGELSSFTKAVLPVTAAVGGALVPALIYGFMNQDGEAARGWGIPMATDIAFALGVLALFGKRVPIGLKVFLTALAIADDLLAVLVIAIFYTEQISVIALSLAVAFLGIIYWATRYNVRQGWFYLLLIVGVWLCIYASGVHATTSGVMIALLVPVRPYIDPRTFFDTVTRNIELLRRRGMNRESIIADGEQRHAIEEIYLAAEDMQPPGIYFEEKLHAFQAFVVLPLFALFSAGVIFDAATLNVLSSNVSLGIVLGLVLGKQVGILSFSWLAIRLAGAQLPSGVTWRQLWGTSALAGIGFTMSIFIADLGFDNETLLAEAKLGIFLASLIAAIWGFLVLNKVLPTASE